MAKSRLYLTDNTDAGKRLDSVLAEKNFYPSRSAAAHAIEAGKVLVGGKEVSKHYRVEVSEPIVYEVEDEGPETPLQGEAIPLDIRYEDEYLLVLSKQKGLVCHPSADHFEGTLVNALIYHCGIDHLCNVQGEADRLGIVHRLDMDTTGLMLAAKDDETGYALMDAIRQKLVERHYLALVHGLIAPDTGLIDAPIARHPKIRTRMAIHDGPSAREAITTFRVLERFEAGSFDNGYTLIDCKLSTGRTHQIRVHMEYTKHPLVGDPLYRSSAPRDDRADLGLDRQFLHSFFLRFTHPQTEEELEFLDPLPQDLRTVWESLQGQSLGRTTSGDEVFEVLNKKN
ncbi:MAG: RluA family pseudouridine synthase [Eggerthellaceae bacterium]|jgi:23S rRNA pseudouridine1911/1915/1917 synthase